MKAKGISHKGKKPMGRESITCQRALQKALAVLWAWSRELVAGDGREAAEAHSGRL